MKHFYKASGVCAGSIEFELDGETVGNVRFQGGCNGNAQGVSQLCAGQNARDVVARLRGIHCGGKNTSCPDQLARALCEALQLSYEEEAAG